MPIEPEKKEKLTVSVLTGGKDPHYALGLLSGLLSKKIVVEFIGNSDMQQDPAVKKENVVYYDLRGEQDAHANLKEKIIRVLKYYAALIKYAATTDSKLFHILWLNKFEYLDRTILNLYYKLTGKSLVVTAHNVNTGERDGKDTWLNRLSLKIMYSLMDGIIVHTEKMKRQIVETFNIRERKVYVIPYGINNAVPRSPFTSVTAKKKLSLEGQKVILFFGNIAPYKGLEHLILAAADLKQKMPAFKLLIAGPIKKDCEAYWQKIEKLIAEHELDDFVIRNIRYIPDQEIEVYYKAADVLILPYNHIFQSGVIFLAYSFGLPVIASDVGSLREDVVEGVTGYICKPGDPRDLGEKIDLYFKSDLFKNLESNRNTIMDYAAQKHSWDVIGEKTWSLYKSLV